MRYNFVNEETDFECDVCANPIPLYLRVVQADLEGENVELCPNCSYDMNREMEKLELFNMANNIEN